MQLNQVVVWFRRWLAFLTTSDDASSPSSSSPAAMTAASSSSGRPMSQPSMLISSLPAAPRSSSARTLPMLFT